MIDWQYHDAPPKDRPNFASVEHYMSYRDFVVVQWPKSEKWHTVMADVEDSVAHVRLNAPPGETEVHWHPPYNYAQSERFVKSLRDQPLVKVEKIGESPEGRNLWLLRITDTSPRSKENFLIRARVHPYESASSYSMEGMVQWLLSDDAYAAAALRHYVFYVLPMANPDGVHNGLGALTAPRGADVCFIPYEPDEVMRSMKEAIDQVRPAVAIDLHNWQNKHTDGLLGWTRQSASGSYASCPTSCSLANSGRSATPSRYRRRYRRRSCCAATASGTSERWPLRSSFPGLAERLTTCG